MESQEIHSTVNTQLCESTSCNLCGSYQIITHWATRLQQVQFQIQGHFNKSSEIHHRFRWVSCHRLEIHTTTSYHEHHDRHHTTVKDIDQCIQTVVQDIIQTTCCCTNSRRNYGLSPAVYTICSRLVSKQSICYCIFHSLSPHSSCTLLVTRHQYDGHSILSVYFHHLLHPTRCIAG